MGVFASRQNGGVEELDIAPNHAYRYPPKSGCYFGSYFIMGGERFESTQPEAYLFGENQDLNFLGARPLPFPYPAPQSNEPTKTIKSLVNIRKDSLRLVRILDDEQRDVSSQRLNTTGGSKDGVSLKSGVEVPSPDEDTVGACQKTSPLTSSGAKYNVEFTFDADARCAITIYYFVSETIDGHHAIYVPRDADMNSETYHYKAGANQQFVQTTHVLEPGRYSDDDWHMVGGEKDIIPIVIQCVVEDEEDHIGHSHMTFACVEKTSDGYAIKALKQKQMVDGLCYLLQEIYGIENKKAHVDASKAHGDGDGGGGGCDDDPDDNGSECVICMSDVRDTLILPCRHLCLCNGCADSLRYQANNCPICRAPFRALLQIRAMRKKTQDSIEVSPEVECPVNQEGCPPGYEAISLIEALNGPATPTHRVVPSDGVVGDAGGDIGVVHAVGDSVSSVGASSGVPQSRSSMAEVTSSGGTGQGRSSSGSHRSKRRTSSARAGSGRGPGRSTMGSPRVNPGSNLTTPSTTPLLHHTTPPITSDPALCPVSSDHGGLAERPLNDSSSRCSTAPRGSSAAASQKGAAGACSVPRCRSVEDEGDFAIVSIPARRARIAKMGEDVESLGSAMSESPSCDAVMTRPTSTTFLVSSGVQQDAAVDRAVDNGAGNSPGDEAATPESPSTPVAPLNDVAMEEGVDNVEVIGSAHSTSARRSTPAAADV